jgi:hypothetical protein
VPGNLPTRPRRANSRAAASRMPLLTPVIKMILSSMLEKRAEGRISGLAQLRTWSSRANSLTSFAPLPLCSAIASTSLRDDDHARMFWKLDGRIKGADQAVFDDAGDSHWLTARAGHMYFHRGGNCAGSYLGRGQLRLSSDLIIACSPFGASGIGCWSRHGICVLIGSDHKNRWLAKFAKDIRNFVFLSVISPYHPNVTPRRSFRKHLERAVRALIQTVNPIKSRLYFIRGQSMRFDLLKIPFDPLKLPHAQGL